LLVSLPLSTIPTFQHSIIPLVRSSLLTSAY
jgi:hypothetical protein